jgi:hypothetical protein
MHPTMGGPRTATEPDFPTPQTQRTPPAATFEWMPPPAQALPRTSSQGCKSHAFMLLKPTSGHKPQKTPRMIFRNLYATHPTMIHRMALPLPT